MSRRRRMQTCQTFMTRMLLCQGSVSTIYYTIPYYTIYYYILLYYTILYYTILYYTISDYTICYTGPEKCPALVASSSSRLRPSEFHFCHLHLDGVHRLQRGSGDFNP